ncbi:general L-amino acid transport system permease protein [Pseudomonas fluvialis]|uniref:General L-amino acid transport system permease protein n=1 Tax=Pseudomonas fluvialis TaxID=1793966 RepID=A0A7X0EQB9_9PSED|nr:amino acid ABC transporter permease [Pseudomonas fluvialis]MBB6339858.1 general L-amino acid transport system permease protein [Pseudomonas fluvialis]
MRSSVPEPQPKPSWLTDPQVRAWLFQVLAVIFVVACGWFLFHNTQTNLAHRGILSGFGFLDNSAGFGISQHLIDYRESDSYARVFVIGVLNTLLVSLIGIALATVLGFVVGMARLSPNWLLRQIATVYIEVFRNIPPLLQIFFWYFAILQPLPGPKQSLALGELFFVNNRGLYMPAPSLSEGFMPVLVAFLLALVACIVCWRRASVQQELSGDSGWWRPLGVGLLLAVPLLTAWALGSPFTWSVPTLSGFNFRGGWVVIPELVALTLALTIYTAAFIAETVRSGIQSVSHGQTEAARSLGLRPQQTLRLVIIPQALRVIIPPLTSQYLNLTKNSSLAAGIGYPDMVSLFAGTVLNQTGQAIETMAITMSVYLAISISISLLMNLYNKRIALVER